jgi:hypothetical protein
MDLIPPEAMFTMGRVMCEGKAKGYGDGNWRKIGRADHINHALGHLYAYLWERARDPLFDGEDHLGHALCRVAMAVSVEEEG